MSRHPYHFAPHCSLNPNSHATVSRLHLRRECNYDSLQPFINYLWEWCELGFVNHISCYPYTIPYIHYDITNHLHIYKA